MLFSLDNDIQHQQPQNKTRAIALGVFLLASLGVAVYGVTRAAPLQKSEQGAPEQKKEVQEPAYTPPAITKDDHARGVGELQNALIVYSDFQCPVCAPYASMMSEVEKKFRGKLTVVYRNFPKDAIHENARRAAQAAQAAGEQGKFWQMHDLLYKKQDEWSVSNQSQEVITRYAKSLLLDMKKFIADMESQAIDDSIQRDIQSGQDAGVDTVPTFFLNGVKISSPRTVEEFKKIVGQEIKGT